MFEQKKNSVVKGKSNSIDGAFLVRDTFGCKTSILSRLREKLYFARLERDKRVAISANIPQRLTHLGNDLEETGIFTLLNRFREELSKHGLEQHQMHHFRVEISISFFHFRISGSVVLQKHFCHLL